MLEMLPHKHMYFLPLSNIFLFLCFWPFPCAIINLILSVSLSHRLPLSLSPLLLYLFCHFHQKEKQALSPLNRAFLCPSIPEHGFCPAAQIHSVYIYEKTHTRTVVKADYSCTAHSVDSYFFFYCLFPIVPTTHR